MGSGKWEFWIQFNIRYRQYLPSRPFGLPHKEPSSTRRQECCLRYRLSTTPASLISRIHKSWPQVPLFAGHQDLLAAQPRLFRRYMYCILRRVSTSRVSWSSWS